MAKLSRNAKQPPRTGKDPLQRAEDLFSKRYPPRPDAAPPEVVDPRWLLKAAAIALAGALVCAYATLCLLVYQGQWQLMLNPLAGPPLNAPPLQQTLQFGAGTTGQPQLAGLWLPEADGSPLTPTILYLPDGSGNLAADADALLALHTLPINLFAFDYRSFGASAHEPHPTEASMSEDAEAALDYLINTRHLAPATIVPYGVGLGASLAARLCRLHPALAAMILEAPRPNANQAALADRRARLVPLRLFFHEQFLLTPTLHESKTPKLLLDDGPSYVASPDAVDGFTRLTRSAASPSMTVHLSRSPSNQSPLDRSPSSKQALLPLWRAGVLRFLDEYLPAPATGLGAKPTP